MHVQCSLILIFTVHKSFLCRHQQGKSSTIRNLVKSYFQFDIWQVIRRKPKESTYSLKLKYRGYRPAGKRPKTAQGTVQRRRKHHDTDQISDSEGRSSVQSNYTETGLEADNYFKEDYDFDGNEFDKLFSQRM